MEVSLTPVQRQFYRAIYEKNTQFLFKGARPVHAPSLMNIMMELRKVGGGAPAHGMVSEFVIVFRPSSERHTDETGG